MEGRATRRMGFLIVWAVLLLIFAFVQMGHHIELSKRSVWMDRVDEKLNVHERKLDLLAETVSKLPNSMVEKFNERYRDR
jgi:hypothetical protein